MVVQTGGRVDAEESVARNQSVLERQEGVGGVAGNGGIAHERNFKVPRLVDDGEFWFASNYLLLDTPIFDSTEF